MSDKKNSPGGNREWGYASTYEDKKTGETRLIYTSIKKTVRLIDTLIMEMVGMVMLIGIRKKIMMLAKSRTGADKRATSQTILILGKSKIREVAI